MSLKSGMRTKGPHPTKTTRSMDVLCLEVKPGNDEKLLGTVHPTFRQVSCKPCTGYHWLDQLCGAFVLASIARSEQVGVHM